MEQLLWVLWSIVFMVLALNTLSLFAPGVGVMFQMISIGLTVGLLLILVKLTINEMMARP